MPPDKKSQLKIALKRHVGLDDNTIADFILSLATQGESAVRRELADFPKKFVTETLKILGLFQETQPITSSAQSENNDQEVRVGKRYISHEIVAHQQKPAFLQGEQFSHASRIEAVAARKPQWLQSAAQHTSAKIAEASSQLSHARPQTALNSHPVPVSKPNQRASNRSTELPIHKFRTEILQAVAEYSIIVLVGDTGSGKTTQITQFLHEAGYSLNGKVIACTQPRRLAAISIARRVAFEMRSNKVGKLVGYSVRFDDCTSDETQIKYMTDGLLLREAISDPDLSKYSVIMLDEAHERTVATDVLFALVKAAVARRPDLRIIVTSATLDASKYGAYFGDAPVVRIPGRMFPVTIEWAHEPILDYMEAALETVKNIHAVYTAKAEEGDILVFLTGQAEIDLAVASIQSAYPKGDLMPLPVYAAIPNEMQSLIFDPPPPGKRKVVFATNIAETSLTIDGIKFVVDTGFAKFQVWDAEKGMGLLRVEPISQAQANQRSGRAGRTAPGVCYRLYTNNSFVNEMIPSTLPEIQRENLGHVILLLKELGIRDLLEFDFMDPPPRASLASSMNDLFTLGAIDDSANMTDVGHSMASLPLDPALAKVFITAEARGGRCMEDVLTILSMMSMPSVFYRPTQPASKRLEADSAHKRLQDSSSDHMTLLKVYQSWKESGCNKKWCSSNYLQHKNLMKVEEARRQLRGLVTKNASRHPVPKSTVNWSERKMDVLRTLCSGFFQNVAKRDNGAHGRGGSDYITLLTNANVSIHPSSTLYKQQVEYVLYGSLVLTSKEYMMVVSHIETDWLLEAAPNVYKAAELDDLVKRQRTESISPLYKKHSGNTDEWRVSQQRKLLGSKKPR